jgi:hypothetical protein
VLQLAAAIATKPKKMSFAARIAASPFVATLIILSAPALYTRAAEFNARAMRPSTRASKAG